MSNLLEHAKRELALAKMDESLYEDLLPKLVLELIETFANQGHTGMSAPITISLFTDLASYKPLTPLTGADDEWTDVGDGLLQNIRASHVFKENGKAYNITGRIFQDPDGLTWTNFDSRVPVTFPYMPKSEIVQR